MSEFHASVNRGVSPTTERKLLPMKTAVLLFLLQICWVSLAWGQHEQQAGSRGAAPPHGMCGAAASRLHESGANTVVLTMVVGTSGRVQSFTTESPKGLRLEKMKEPAAAIKAIHFRPAKKDGRPVRVTIRVLFDCSGSASDTASPSR